MRSPLESAVQVVACDFLPEQVLSSASVSSQCLNSTILHDTCRLCLQCSPTMQCLTGEADKSMMCIHQTVMILRKAARFVFSDYLRYSSVSAILNEFDWRTLEERRDNSHHQILYTAPGVTAENFYTCHQRLIFSNIHFSQLQSDYGITCQITLLRLRMLILLNHYCSYLLT